MSNIVKAKATYVVQTMVCKDTSNEHSAVMGLILKAVHYVKAQWWIVKINHMSEGEILNLYYLLTDGGQVK